jgi:HPt (histidine-containing phosphotransfer) domain-containing protein
MDDYVVKPVEPRELIEVLDKWLSIDSPSSEKKRSSHISDQNTLEDESVYDEDRLMGRVMGNCRLARELIGLFLDDVPRRINSLKNGLDKGDQAAVQLEAHTLKTAGYSVGAGRMASSAQLLENAIRQSKNEQVPLLIQKIELEFETARKAMQASSLND